MKTKNPLRILCLCFVLLVVIMLTGCRAAQRKPYSTRTPAPITPSPMGTTPRTTPAPMTPTGPLPTKTKEVADLQDKLAKEAEKVPGVNKAWVVLSGGTALVGTELKSDIPRGSQGDAAGIKNEVMMRLRKADTRLTGVAVTTDAGTVSKLRKVAEGMRAGKTTTTFTRDVNDLVTKLTPGMR
ncbi:MAG: YhcN/YlaJ family sporulation lipoprotein [bacterium]